MTSVEHSDQEIMAQHNTQHRNSRAMCAIGVSPDDL